jgi:uncharacterized protein YqeY
MSLRDRLLEDLKSAMKAQDARRLAMLRMLKSEMLKVEVNLRETKGLDYHLDDAEATRVVSTYAKQRRESIEAYRKGGREDLATQEEAELQMVEAYLPKALGEDEVRAAVQAVIAETGATSKKDLGAVMKGAMARLQGAADGKLVSRIAGELLGP